MNVVEIRKKVNIGAEELLHTKGYVAPVGSDLLGTGFGENREGANIYEKCINKKLGYNFSHSNNTMDNNIYNWYNKTVVN